MKASFRCMVSNSFPDTVDEHGVDLNYTRVIY